MAEKKLSTKEKINKLEQLSYKYGLTPKEQRELDNLKAETLTPEEFAEMQALEAKAAGLTEEEFAEMQALEAKAKMPIINDEDIVNEMPPELQFPNSIFSGQNSFLPRAAYKMFGTESPESIAFLQKYAPKGYTVKRIKTSPDAASEIIYEKPETRLSTGEISPARMYRLDPTTFELRDIPEALWDVLTAVGQGVASGAAGLYGGVLGGATSGGTLALPSALLAAGATGGTIAAGSEAARQGIGKALGINPDVDWNEVKNVGYLNAALTPVFGAGGSMAGAGRYAQKEIEKGLGKKAVERLAKMGITDIGQADIVRQIMHSQKGLINRAGQTLTNIIAPKIGAALSDSDITEEVIKRAKNILPTIRAAEQKGGYVVPLEKLAKIGKGVESAYKAELARVGKDIGSAVAKADELYGQKILMKDILAPINDYAAEINRRNISPKGEDLTELAKALSDVPYSIVNEKVVEKVPIYKRDLLTNANIVDKYEDVIKNNIPEYLLPSRAKDLRDSLNREAKTFGFKLKNAGTMQSTTPNLFGELEQKAASSIGHSAAAAEKAVEKAVSSVDPALGRKYISDKMTYIDLLKNLPDYEAVSDEDILAKLISRASGKSNIGKYTSRKIIDRASDLSGIDIPNEALTFQAINKFSKPAFEHMSSDGVTSTSRNVLPFMTGAMATEAAIPENTKPGVKWAMRAIGANLAAKAGTPAMLRRYMDIGEKIGESGNILRNLGWDALAGVKIPGTEMSVPSIRAKLPDIMNKYAEPGDLIRATPYLLMQSGVQER
jgi:hypothetical protein